MILLKVQEQSNQWMDWMYQVNNLNPIISTLTVLRIFSLESVVKIRLSFQQLVGSISCILRNDLKTLSNITLIWEDLHSSEAAST